jgi:hypothetical protein
LHRIWTQNERSAIYRRTQEVKITPTDCSVEPWLVASVVREPTIRSANSDIENKVERYGGIKMTKKKKKKKSKFFKTGRRGHIDSESCTHVDRKEPSFRGPPKG